MSDFYYKEAGVVKGPISAQEVRQRFAKGKLSSTTLVRSTQSNDWRPVGEVKGMTDSLPIQANTARPRGKPPTPYELDRRRTRHEIGGSEIEINLFAAFGVLVAVVGLCWSIWYVYRSRILVSAAVAMVEWDWGMIGLIVAGVVFVGLISLAAANSNPRDLQRAARFVQDYQDAHDHQELREEIQDLNDRLDGLL